jgi:hypothetical protein
MTIPLHVYFLRAEQQPLEALHETLLRLHLDELWMRLPRLGDLRWGDSEVLQLEMYHLRDGTPVMPEAAGQLLSAHEREALRLSVDSTRTSVAFELFRNGESVSSWAGDVECFGSEDKRAKKDRSPEDLAVCRKRFQVHFRAETGLDFEELVTSKTLRADAAEEASDHTVVLIRGRLVSPPKGMGRWPELFRFHDRNFGEESPGTEHAALIGLDLQLTEKLWKRTPAGQVYQYLRMIEPLRQLVLGPLSGLLHDVLGIVEAHPPEQSLASAAEPSLTVYEVLAMSTSLAFMVGDRVEWLDERFYPLLSLSESPLTRAVVEESADDIDDADVVTAMTEVMPYSVPEGAMMEAFADEELAPLASWAVQDDSYEGSLFLVDTCRLRALVEKFDIDVFNQRLAEFRKLWFEVKDPAGGSVEEWVAGRGDRDTNELSRFEDSFVELQHLLPLCDRNGLTPALLFYSE